MTPAAGLSRQELVHLVNADLLTCGVASIIQALGVRKVGARLPLVQGVTFTAVSPMIAIGTGAGGGWLVRMSEVMSRYVVVAAGVFMVVLGLLPKAGSLVASIPRHHADPALQRLHAPHHFGDRPGRHRGSGPGGRAVRGPPRPLRRRPRGREGRALSPARRRPAQPVSARPAGTATPRPPRRSTPRSGRRVGAGRPRAPPRSP
ncbi:solute carrier family 23 protein [Streptomyces sp. NPDC090045]|uniref:solute carrier family 23 protein n=1 Tax=Streptomyces sp. NPDC090045 TaxID=3365927 RepID=UPI00382C9966